MVFAGGNTFVEGHIFFIPGESGQVVSFVVLVHHTGFPVANAHFVEVKKTFIPFVGSVIHRFFIEAPAKKTGFFLGRRSEVLYTAIGFAQVKVVNFVAPFISGVNEVAGTGHVIHGEDGFGGRFGQGTHALVGQVDLVQVKDARFVAVYQEFAFIRRKKATTDALVGIKLFNAVLFDIAWWCFFWFLLAGKSCDQDSQEKKDFFHRDGFLVRNGNDNSFSFLKLP